MTSVHLLHAGYAHDRVGSSVVLVRDGDALIIVDPGMVARRSLILDPLRELGVAPEAVTHVFLSHHHPDHTMNVALFPAARVHDHQAIYQNDVWQDRPAEGFGITPAIRLLETPGHTAQDVTTLVGTRDGIVALTHAWWSADGPAEDPFAPDAAVLARARRRILALADLVIPGHGAPFRPATLTPV